MREPTAGEINGFFLGMLHSMKVAQETERGKVASRAIQREITTLALCHDVKKRKEKEDVKESA